MHASKNLFVGLTRALEYVSRNMQPGEIETLTRYLSRGGRGFTSSMEYFAKAICDSIAAPSSEFRFNGEAALIERTSGLGFKTIFDVGANIGDWTRHAWQHHPDAAIHSFEIMPATFAILQVRAATLGNRVTLNSFGLSDQTRELKVNYTPDNLYISSVHDFGYSGSQQVTCQVRTGDEYVAQNDIRQIDFLKIDVEGDESGVIHGLRGMFDQRKVRLAQFEYGRGAILSRYLLRDFYEFFKPRGYAVGRLLPAGVQFRDYHLSHEDFNGPNYVACLEDDRVLIEAVRAM